MKNHFYISIKTPRQEKDILTMKVENELLKKLQRNGKKHNMSQVDYVNNMWRMRDWNEVLVGIAISYVSNTETYKTATELFTDIPFVVCMELTSEYGFGKVQMCGSASLKEDTELEAVKVSKEQFNLVKNILQTV